MRSALLVLLALLLTSCGSDTAPVETLNSLQVRLPNGKKIRAEIMKTQEEMLKGMMFRTSLPADRGMLFVHERPGRYAYWMYQVVIPLDIVWMDRDHRIVEISANTPPCKTVASQCPTWGGHEEAKYVLELAGGGAAANRLKAGDRLEF